MPPYKSPAHSGSAAGAIVGRTARRKPKPKPRLTLVSPINRAGRRKASTKVVQRKGTYVARRAAPARQPNRAIPKGRVTPARVEARQARHMDMLQAHRTRVKAKQAKQARAKYRTAKPTGKLAYPNIAVQNYRDPRAQPSSSLYQRNTPQLQHLRASGHRLISFNDILKATGFSGESAVKNATAPSRNKTVQAITHPAKVARKLGHFSNERSLEASVPGYKSASIPHVSPGKAAYSIAVVANEARKGNLKPLGKTAKDLGIFVATAPAGIVQGAVDPVGTVAAYAKDANRRYKGSYHDVYQRVKKHGAASEIADLATVITPSAVGVGRGLSSAAERGALGAKARRLVTEPRPELGHGNLSRKQDLGENLFRVLGQRAEDRYRVGRVERKNKRAAKAGRAMPGLQPRDRQTLLRDIAELRRTQGRRARMAPKGSMTGFEARMEVQRARMQAQRVRAGKGTAEVIPVWEKRAQRVEQSRIQSKHYQRFKARQIQDVLGNEGARTALARLPKHTREAATLAIKGGMPLDKVRAEPWLKDLRDQMMAEHVATGRTGVPKGVEQIDSLRQHIDKIDWRKLTSFQGAERARTERIAASDRELNPMTAEVHSRRAQAYGLGIEHEHDALVRSIEQRAEADLRKKPPEGMSKADWHQAVVERRAQEVEAANGLKPLLDQQFIARTDAAAEKAGLPPAAYVKDYKTRGQVEATGTMALGGARAASNIKQSKLALFSTGRADLTPQAYLQSVNESLKRQANHDLIDEQATAHSLPSPSTEEQVAALGHEVKPGEITADQWRQILEKRGWDAKDWVPWSPGAFRDALKQTEGEATAKTAGGTQISDFERAIKAGFNPDPTRVKGVHMIPKEVYREIADRHSGTIGRGLDKFLGLQSGLILGLSPKWAQFQIAANAFLSGFSVRGNPLAYAKAPLEWKKAFTPEVRAYAEEMFGTGSGRAHASQRVHMGGAVDDHGLVMWGRTWKETQALRYRHVKDRIPVVKRAEGNPLFQLDAAQNDYFKKVVFTSEVKRLAFKQMQRDMGTLNGLMARVQHLFTLGPVDQMRHIVENPDLLDQVLRHTDDVLGNYVRYTAKERAGIRHFAIFYGFMRYALRTAFYTAPVKHPLVTSIVLKLDQLHKDEVDRLMGGHALPWTYGRLFFSSHSPLALLPYGEKVPGKDDLFSIDLGRMSPTQSVITDLGTEGTKALASPFLSPYAQTLANVFLYKQDLTTGRPYRYGGSTAERGLPTKAKGRILLNEGLKLFTPVREFERITQPYKTTPDTLPWDPMRIRYKDPELRAQQHQRVKDSQSQSLVEQILGAAIAPYPIRDTSRDTIANSKRNQPKRNKASGGSNVYDELNKLRSGGGSNPYDELSKLRGR